jgi:gliding motility-associated-like protein
MPHLLLHPNGDNRNDVFRPMLFGNIKKYHFTVYNRWGQIVFRSTELHKGWDGKVGGMTQRSDAFVWTCLYQFEGEKERIEKGSVTVIR